MRHELTQADGHVLASTICKARFHQSRRAFFAAGVVAGACDLGMSRGVIGALVVASFVPDALAMAGFEGEPGCLLVAEAEPACGRGPGQRLDGDKQHGYAQPSHEMVRMAARIHLSISIGRGQKGQSK